MLAALIVTGAVKDVVSSVPISVDTTLTTKEVTPAPGGTISIETSSKPW